MKNRHKLLFLFFLVVAICGALIASIFIQNDSNHQLSTVKISNVDNPELFCKKHNISFSATDDIQYYIINEKSVLVWDQRNSEKSRYVHSEINAFFDKQRILTVIITDSVAISENDISGNHAVLIECENKIENVIIEQEDKTK